MSGGSPGLPPKLPGYTYLSHLGSGGFADVFLFEQRMPHRKVAVKVLHADVVTDPVREQFDAEANLMATLCEHPSIVSVYDVGIAGDGRPYIVLEYCSGPNLYDRYHCERIPVSEALRMGVRLASAVETAHRRGILHRDIKPANVLTTASGWPKLTDFGVAIAGAAPDGTAGGISIPWAAPELIDEATPGDVASDVYALAATLYTLLAGRPPFHVPKGANSNADLIRRAQTRRVSPTGRPDVPPSLEEALARGLARRPVERPGTAAAFANLLGQVEAELHLAVTPFELVPGSALTASVGEDGHTPNGNLMVDPPSGASRTWPPDAVALSRGVNPSDPGRPALSPGLHSVVRVPATPDDVAPREASLDNTAPRPPRPGSAAHPEPIDPPPPFGKRRLIWSIAATAAVLAAAGSAFASGLFAGDAPPADAGGTGSSQGAPIDVVPAPDVTGVPAPYSTGGAGLRFTWTYADRRAGDYYAWRLDDPEHPALAGITHGTELLLPAEVGERVCVEVIVTRESGQQSEPRTGCGDAGGDGETTPSGGCPGSDCEEKSPWDQGWGYCGNTEESEAIDSAPVYDASDVEIADLRLYRSARCSTVWAELFIHGTGVHRVIDMYLYANGQNVDNDVQENVAYANTLMLSESPDRCIRATATVYFEDPGAGHWGEVEVAANCG